MPNSGFAKLFSWSAIAITALIAIVGSLLFYRYSVFQSMLSDLRNNGEKLSIQEYAHDVEDDNNDAAFFLNAAFRDIVAVTTAIYDVGEPPIYGPLSTEMTDRFDELMKEHDDLIANLCNAAKASDISVSIDSPVTINYGSNNLPFRGASRILAWQAKVLVETGKTDEAIENCFRIFKIARHSDQYPTISEFQTSAVGCRWIALSALHDILSRTVVSDTTRSKIHTLLESIDLTSNYTDALASERAYGLDLVMGKEGHLPAAYIVFGKEYLETMAKGIQQSQLPMTTELPKPEYVDVSTTVRWFGPNLESMFYESRNIVGNLQARVRALRIISALQTDPASDRRTEFSQEYLIGLGVPEGMTTDVFSERTFSISRIDNHWKVYSWGADRKDDGGSIQDRLDVGMYPSSQ